MKVLKIFVIALLLSLVFSLGVVTAQENITFDQSNTMAVSTETDVTSEINQGATVENTNAISSEIENIEKLQNSGENQILDANNGSSTVGANIEVEGYTYDDIQNAINAADEGDTIYLYGSTYTGSQEIVIDKSITIIGGSKDDGEMHATLNSQGFSRAMAIVASEVTLHGITFINGNDDDGGAVYIMADDCILSSCWFINNSASQKGGAIYNEGHGLTLITSMAINNTAHDGGFVYSLGNQAYLNDINSTNNTVIRQGGSIFLKGDDNELYHNRFYSNHASYDGGAVYIYGDDNRINNCSFVENYGFQGGALYVEGNDFEMNESIFILNRAEYAGAMFWIGERGEILASDFIHNEAITGGALIWICTESTLDSVRFEGNSADDRGGAIFTYAGFYNLTNNLFEGNSARHGGACYFEWGYANIDDSAFIGNVAEEDGGALAGNGNYIYVNASNFDDNSARNGGAINWYSSGGGISDCNFTGNYALSSGGAITLRGDSGITGSNFLYNYAKYAGAIHIYSDNATFDSNNFTDNDAAYSGSTFVLEGPNNSITNNVIVHSSINPAVYAVIYDNLVFENNGIGEEEFCYPSFAVEIDDTFLFKTNEHAQISFYAHDNFDNPLEGEVYISALGRHIYVTDGVGTCEWNTNGVPKTIDCSFTFKSVPVNFKIIVAKVSQPDVDGDRVQVNLTSKVSGNLTLQINGKTYFSNITGGIANFDIDDLPNGSYTGKMNYSGDEKYSSASRSVSVNLKNSDVGLYINTVDSIIAHIGETIQIPVHVNTSLGDNSVGFVYMNIYGANQYSKGLSLIDGEATFDVPITRSQAKTTITVRYMQYSKTIDLEILDSAKPIKSVSQENNVVTVEFEKDVTGNVTITVGGIEFNATIENAKAVIPVNRLPNGNYSGVILYHGDANYSTESQAFSMPITGSSVRLLKDVPEYVFGLKGSSIEVTLRFYTSLGDNLSGEVKFDYSGFDFHETLQFVNGTLTFTLPLGTVVSYHHLEYTYMGSPDLITVMVIDPASPIRSISYWNTDLVVDVPPDAKANVTVTIAGKQYTAVPIEGRAFISLSDFPNGTFTAKIGYGGDDVYSRQEFYRGILVAKSNVTLTIVADEQIIAHAGETLQIPVQVLTSLGDYLSGSINAQCVSEGFQSFVSILNGIATVKFPIPDNSTTLGLTLSYLTYSKDIQIIVYRSENPIQNIYHDDNCSIIVELPGDAGGKVTVTIHGKEYNSTVNNGVSIVNIGNLPNGTYSAKIEYLSNGFYSNDEETFQTIINNSNIKVNIDSSDELIGHAGRSLQIPVHVYSDLGEDLGGKIDAYCDDEDFESSITLIEGRAIFDVPMPHIPTTMEVVISYLNHYIKTVSITVVDTTKPIEEITQDDENDTIKITLPEDATGNVTVKIGDKNYTGEIINGTAIINIDDLPNGTYEAEITYDGDGNYSAINETITVVIKNSNVGVVIDANSIIAKVGESVILPINVYLTNGETAWGDITVTCPEIHFNLKETLMDGRAILDIPLPNAPTTLDLVIGYLESQKTIQIMVIDVGQTESENDTVIINLPPDAEGNVTIIIGNKNYTGEINNGTVVINITDLPNGTYDAIINFTDKNGTSFTENTTVVIKNSNVTKLIMVPDNVIGYIGMTLQLPVLVYTSSGDPLDGDVEVYGVGYDYESTEKLANGRAIFKIPMPNYPTTLDLMFFYNHMHRTVRVTVVDPQNPIEDITQPDDDNDTVVIKLPDDANGTVTVLIEGKNYTVPVINGSAVVDIKDLPNGTYAGTIIYSGDNHYHNMTKVINVVVKNSQVSPASPVYKLIGKDISVIYSGKATYTVLVTRDGKPVVGESVTINFNGKDTVVKTDNKGYATLNLNTNVKVKTYTLKVTCNGITTTNKVKVSQIIKAPNKKVKKSKKVTKVKIILKKVNGKYLKAKKITIKLKGKKYKVKTNKKGVAVWKVKKSMLKKLKVGKKYKYSVTYGKATLTKKLTIKK